MGLPKPLNLCVRFLPAGGVCSLSSTAAVSDIRDRRRPYDILSKPLSVLPEAKLPQPVGDFRPGNDCTPNHWRNCCTATFVHGGLSVRSPHSLAARVSWYAPAGPRFAACCGDLSEIVFNDAAPQELRALAATVFACFIGDIWYRSSSNAVT
jgi:hypothetical protein